MRSTAQSPSQAVPHRSGQGFIPMALLALGLLPTCSILGVDSFSILFSHRSFQKPAFFSPGVLMVFLERMGKVPLELRFAFIGYCELRSLPKSSGDLCSRGVVLARSAMVQRSGHDHFAEAGVCKSSSHAW